MTYKLDLHAVTRVLMMLRSDVKVILTGSNSEIADDDYILMQTLSKLHLVTMKERDCSTDYEISPYGDLWLQAASASNFITAPPLMLTSDDINSWWTHRREQVFRVIIDNSTVVNHDD